MSGRLTLWMGPRISWMSDSGTKNRDCGDVLHHELVATYATDIILTCKRDELMIAVSL